MIWIATALLLFAVLAILASQWADQRARRETVSAAQQAAMSRAGLLTSELQKFQLLPVVLPEYPDVRAALARPDPKILTRLDDTLGFLAARTDAAAIYLIDRKGKTIAASNWQEQDSFIGQDYSFRPYFRQALRNGSAQLFALGTVSGKPGLYISRRVEQGGKVLGVLVVKVEFDSLEQVWATQSGITAVADEHGVIIITSRPDWRFHSLAPLSSATRQALQRTLQFGQGLVQPLDVNHMKAGEYRIGKADYLASSTSVPLLHARLINFQPAGPDRRAAHALVRMVLAIAFVLFLLVLGLIFRARERRAMQIAARKALEEEVALRTAELRTTNERLRAESQERALADNRYRRAREELAQANRLGSIGQITAGVAHEINQPVAAIRTFAENAGRFLERGADDKARTNLTHIVGLTERIGAITAELRAFARRGTPAIGAVELSEVIDGTLLLIGDRIHAANIRLERIDADAPIQVAADRVRLEQILVNLLQNAIQALERTHEPVIRISSTNAATIVIADNGPGIDPAIARDLFTPFITSKPDGLGLGLGIARDIAREFGGELTTIASPLGGAAFELRLKRV
ncbi:ATP-binding protein [Stakelama sediminis]|uniref:C4-dicarboxylate transport sensor protein DctB n=1 Tax=Stakelama sediminis TaxID=463200 RepID=A0A840YYD8_9SPHN|nr:cache domain-containing protein [Stakelama sediminis]MBB5718549.1 two-component system C4-dicarboxylate transport sensor histidine kinase DctB [Stakelama sediminis]